MELTLLWSSLYCHGLELSSQLLWDVSVYVKAYSICLSVPLTSLGIYLPSGPSTYHKWQGIILFSGWVTGGGGGTRATLEGPVGTSGLSEMGPRGHQDGVHGFSLVDGVGQTWHMPALSQLGERVWKKFGTHQCFCPQRKCHQIPVPRAPVFMPVISSVCGPGSFQAATCVLGLGGSSFMCKPCKSEISVSPQPSSSPGHKPLWVSKLNVIGGIISLVQELWVWRAQGKGQTSLPSGWEGDPPWMCCPSHLWITARRVPVLTRLHLGPSCPSQPDPFLMSWVVEKLFCSSSSCPQRRLLCM